MNTPSIKTESQGDTHRVNAYDSTWKWNLHLYHRNDWAYLSTRLAEIPKTVEVQVLPEEDAVRWRMTGSVSMVVEVPIDVAIQMADALQEQLKDVYAAAAE